MENPEPIDSDGIGLVPAKTQIIAFNGFAITSDFKKADADKSTPRGYKDSAPLTFDAEKYLILVGSESPSGREESTDDSEVVSLPAPSVHLANPTKGFRAFGSSIRVCPGGQQFAETEILVIFGCILCKFEIGLREDHTPLKMVMGGTRGPGMVIEITLKPRSWD